MNHSASTGSEACGPAKWSPVIARIVLVAACGWMLVVLVLGARMALLDLVARLSAHRSTAISVQTGAPGSASASDSMLLFAGAAAVTYLAVVSVILLCQLVRPRFTLATACIALSGIFLLASVNTGALAATLAAFAVATASWLTGDLVLSVVSPPANSTSLSAITAVRLALGFGVLGTAVLILGAFNGIALLPIVLLGLVVAVAWTGLNHIALAASFRAVKQTSLSSPRLSWFESILLALSAAFFLFASLATFIPESILTASDSVRQHLPQAREIWQSRALLVFPTMDGGGSSVLGASLNAVAYGLGGITAVRVLQVILSLASLVAIAGLGATLSSRLAGIAGAAFFSAMPLVLWLTGHAYPDLLAVLLICASTQCALWWLEDGQRSWLLLAGALGGFSLGTKQISAVVVLALLVALMVSARSGTTFLRRVQVAVIFSIACFVTAIPWFIRVVVLTGDFPLLGTIRSQLANVPLLGNRAADLVQVDAPLAQIVEVVEMVPGGVSRTLPGIVLGPWDLTFHGAYSNWQSVRVGEFGVLLLMFLPLIFIYLCSRGVLLLAITSFLSYVGWVFTIQIPRHLLPSLALFAVLTGIAVSRASTEHFFVSRALPSRLVQVFAVLGLCLTPLFYLPNTKTYIPIAVLAGVESPQDYLARIDQSAAALQDASALAPPDAPLAYIGAQLGDQSLTEARLIFLGAFSPDPEHTLDRQVGSTPEMIFDSFAKMGITYLIWDRPDTRPQDVDSTLLSGAFLLRYASIIGGDSGVYLFELHPSGVPDPTAGDNLLQDPAFASLRKSGNVWNGSRRNLSSTGALTPSRDQPVSQTVDVVPGQQYLLVLQGSCSDPTDKTRVSLTWLNDLGEIIGTTADEMALGTARNSTLMWRTAPESAASVVVAISATGGKPCAVKSIGMYSYAPPRTGQ